MRAAVAALRRQQQARIVIAVPTASADTSEALKVTGVLDVLTHAHRPPLADKDEACSNAGIAAVADSSGQPARTQAFGQGPGVRRAHIRGADVS